MVVEGHHGSINVESSLNRETKVVIDLPIGTAPASADRETG